jgi:hypothetical protein
MSSPKTDVRVTVSKNGPYLVTGDVSLSKQTIVTGIRRQDTQSEFVSSRSSPYLARRAGGYMHPSASTSLLVVVS